MLKILILVSVWSIALGGECSVGHFVEYAEDGIRTTADQYSAAVLTEKIEKGCGCVCNPALDSKCRGAPPSGVSEIVRLKNGILTTMWEEPQTKTTYVLGERKPEMFVDLPCPTDYKAVKSEGKFNCVLPCPDKKKLDTSSSTGVLGVSIKNPDSAFDACDCKLELQFNREKCTEISVAPKSGVPPDCVWDSVEPEPFGDGGWRMPYRSWEPQNAVETKAHPVTCRAGWTQLQGPSLTEGVPSYVCYKRQKCPPSFLRIPCGPQTAEFQQAAVAAVSCVTEQIGGDSNTFHAKGFDNFLALWNVNSGSDPKDIFRIGTKPNEFKNYVYFMQEASECIGYWLFAAEGTAWKKKTKNNCQTLSAPTCGGDQKDIQESAAYLLSDGYFILKYQNPPERFPNFKQGEHKLFFTGAEITEKVPEAYLKEFLDLAIVNYNADKARGKVFPKWGRSFEEIWVTNKRRPGVVTGEQDDHNTGGPWMNRQCKEMAIFVGNPQGLAGFTRQASKASPGTGLQSCLNSANSRWGIQDKQIDITKCVV